MIWWILTQPRRARYEIQFKSYLENKDNELVRVLQSGPVWNTPVKSCQLITEATRWARAAENDLTKFFCDAPSLKRTEKNIYEKFRDKSMEILNLVFHLHWRRITLLHSIMNFTAFNVNCVCWLPGMKIATT